MSDLPGDDRLGIAFGQNLRSIRERWGLSLREVQERSDEIAKSWGHRDYFISASWLSRIEAGNLSVTVPKLVALTAIFGLSPNDLLQLCIPPRPAGNLLVSGSLPNTTLLLNPGPLDLEAVSILPEALITAEPPEMSRLIERPEELPSHYRRGIIGRKDNTMEPMIKAGSIVLIDTQRRTIAKRRDWTHEFDRPIYFLLTRESYYTGFCELDNDKEWLTLVPHALSYQVNRRWRYRKEVEVIGEVAGFLARRS